MGDHCIADSNARALTRYQGTMHSSLRTTNKSLVYFDRSDVPVRT